QSMQIHRRGRPARRSSRPMRQRVGVARTVTVSAESNTIPAALPRCPQEQVMHSASRFAVISLAALFLAASVGAQHAEDKTREVMVTPADIKWLEGPPSLPKGAKIALLEGDPSKKGPFVMRAKLPSGFKIAPHTHPEDERVTVI